MFKLFKTIKSRQEESHGMSMFELTFYFLLLIVGLTFTIALTVWWLSPGHIPHNFSGLPHIFDYIIFGILTYALGYKIVNEIFTWEIAGTIKKPKFIEAPKGFRVAFLTAFVPKKESYAILENTLKAMVNNDYPHDTWLLDEGNDPLAKEICLKYGVKHYSRNGIEKYNLPEGSYKAKTKGGNYNSWFDNYGERYDFVAQLDVDFIPNSNFLSRTLGYFEDPKVAFVGTPQIYGNHSESWIAQGASEQTYNFYGPMQKGLFGKDMTLLIGANHILRVKAHKDIGGYAGHITEDHLTGMKYYANRWKSVYVPEILAIGEGPTSWETYFNQQMRWAYGALDILFREGHKHFGKNKMRLRHFLRFLFLEHFYFTGLVQALGIGLLILYFLFGVNSANVDFISVVIHYSPVFVIQTIFYLWLQKFYIDPKKESGLGLKGRVLSIASGPIFLVAFFSALFHKRLVYKVTPKGDDQKPSIDMAMFMPHFILGSLTLICIIIAPITHHQAIILVFFALLNTISMYLLVGLAMGEYLQQHIQLRQDKIVYLASVLVFLFSVGIGGFLIYKYKVHHEITLASSISENSTALVSPVSQDTKKVNYHIVKVGESLWSIAYINYGKGEEWINIKTPDNSKVIHPGQVVEIPEKLDTD